MKKLALLATYLALPLFISVGCHAQVPPATTAAVSLTWSAPIASASWAGCTATSPCVYAVYRCTASGTVCASTNSASWTEITTASSRPSSTAYSDTTASGLTAYYVVETVQGSHSGPSNMVGPFAVPASPLAPNLNAPTVAAVTMPPSSEQAWNSPPTRLKGVLR